MPNELENTPTEPTLTGGEGGLPTGGTLPTGSEGDGGFAELAEQYGIDVSELSAETLPALEEALRNADSALHQLREEDSLTLTGLNEKAAQYDRMMANPDVRAAMTGQRTYAMNQPTNAPVQEEFFPTEALENAVNSDSPGALSKVLDSGVRKAIDSYFKTVETNRIAPLEHVVTTMVEMTTMDSDYPDWRKDLPRVREVLQTHPEWTIRTAYEKGIVVPRYRQNTSALRDKMVQTRTKKRAVIKDEPAPANKSVTTPVGGGFDTVRDSVLAAMEQVVGGKS